MRICSFTDLPREPDSFAATQGNFFNEDGTGLVPLIDDGSSVVKTDKGLVVIMGCAHAGYTNIPKAVHRQFPKEKLRAVIGGLHLGNASEAVLKVAADFTDGIRLPDFRFSTVTVLLRKPSIISNCGLSMMLSNSLDQKKSPLLTEHYRRVSHTEEPACQK